MALRHFSSFCDTLYVESKWYKLENSGKPMPPVLTEPHSLPSSTSPFPEDLGSTASGDVHPRFGMVSLVPSISKMLTRQVAKHCFEGNEILIKFVCPWMASWFCWSGWWICIPSPDTAVWKLPELLPKYSSTFAVWVRGGREGRAHFPFAVAFRKVTHPWERHR